MSVQGIHGTPTPLRDASSAADRSAAAARTRSAPTSADPQTPEPGSDLDNQPSTPRFPWLSRLTTQLAAASRKPVTFVAPIIGDNLDKRA